MLRPIMPWVTGLMLGIVASWISPSELARGADAETAALVDHLTDVAGLQRGVCSVLGCGDGQVAMELAGRAGFFVHVLDSDRKGIDAARQLLDNAGLHGTSALAEHSPLASLPYADNMVDLVLATCLTDGLMKQLSLVEVARVLRPEGKAILGSPRRGDGPNADQLRTWLEPVGNVSGEVRTDAFGTWLVVTRPPIQGVDAWSHWEHAPDNNPVSTDQVIKAPYMTQWLGQPFYIAMPAITLASGGRIFLATGHIAHHEREEPWLNTLMARNGYNGMVLWKLKLPDGYLAHRSAFIATPEAFYMISLDGTGCSILDPETGVRIGEIRPEGVRGQWKWIAMSDGVLYALVGDKHDPAESTTVRSERPHWSWGDLSEGYYQTRVPWGFGRTLLAYDLEASKTVWTHTEPKPVDSRAMSLGGERLYVYGPDSHVRCIDATCGKPIWTNSDPQLRELIEEKGQRLGSTPGFRSMCFSVCTPKALFFEAQTRANVVAVSLEDGRYLWHRTKTTNNPNMLYLDGKLLVGIGEEGETMVLDPSSGETLDKLGFKKRSCARLTATPDSLFCRGWPEGLTRYDRVNDRVLFDGAVRPSCNDGVIAANGLLYMGPWACDCNLSLMGRVALCSAGDFQVDREISEAAQREVATDDLERVKPLPTSETDWSSYRANASRSAGTDVQIPEQAARIWRFEPQRPFFPTAPTAAGGLVFVGGDDGKVRAIDAVTGKLAWTFITAGRILQPPTIWKGRAYFGSGDGYIYAVEAATGKLLWRFRASPIERRIMVYDSLSSTWPVHTGVVVHNGVVYAAAGIIDYNGTYVYALDAKTGKLVWANTNTGHLDPTLRKGVSAQGTLTVAGGHLWMAGGNVISPAPYDMKTGAYRGPDPGDGSPRANRGEEVAAVSDDCVMVGGRLRFSATTNVVNPGRFEGMPIRSGLQAGRRHHLNTGKIPPAWSADRMVLVDGRNAVPTCYDRSDMETYLKDQDDKAQRPSPVWTAGWMGGRDTTSLVAGPNAMLAVAEHRGWRFQVPQMTVLCMNASDGSKLWEHSLPAGVPPGRMLVDRDGRVIVAMDGGGIECLGGIGPIQAYVKGLIERADDPEVGKQRAIDLLIRVYRAENDPAVREVIVRQLRQLGTDILNEARKSGWIIEWQVIGPVPWHDTKHPTDKVFIGEPDVDTSRSYKVGDQILSWQKTMSDTPDEGINLYRLLTDKPNVAAYASAEVELDRERDLLLKIGSDDGFKAWFNGETVGRFVGSRGYAPDQNALRVHGVKGVNRILLKITQGSGGWAFGARLTEMNNTPVNLGNR